MPGDEESISDDAIWEMLPVSSHKLVLNINPFWAMPYVISFPVPLSVDAYNSVSIVAV